MRETRTLTPVEKARLLDFAYRMVFRGYDNLTYKRRVRLWNDVEWMLTDALEEGHTDWDGRSPINDYSMCAWLHERFEHLEYPSQKWERKAYDFGEWPKYFNMLSATCRASMDIVNDFEGGVWGWTVGDIRRMYGGELPDWFPLEGWHYLGDGPAPPLKDEDSIAL